MQKLLSSLLTVCALSFTTQATAVYQDPIRQQPGYSTVIEIDGQRVIVMPDGRMLPFGQGVNCTDDCEIADEIAVTASSHRWIVPVVAAGVITTSLLWPRNRPARVVIPRTDAPPIGAPSTPVAPVPEPSTLCLLAAGLFALSRIINQAPSRKESLR